MRFDLTLILHCYFFIKKLLVFEIMFLKEQNKTNWLIN